MAFAFTPAVFDEQALKDMAQDEPLVGFESDAVDVAPVPIASTPTPSVAPTPIQVDYGADKPVVNPDLQVQSDVESEPENPFPLLDAQSKSKMEDDDAKVKEKMLKLDWINGVFDTKYQNTWGRVKEAFDGKVVGDNFMIDEKDNGVVTIAHKDVKEAANLLIMVAMQKGWKSIGFSENPSMSEELKSAIRDAAKKANFRGDITNVQRFVEVDSPFADKDKIKNELGGVWNNDSKKWMINLLHSDAAAKYVEEHATKGQTEVLQEIKAEQLEEKEKAEDLFAPKASPDDLQDDIAKLKSVEMVFDRIEGSDATLGADGGFDAVKSIHDPDQLVEIGLKPKDAFDGLPMSLVHKMLDSNYTSLKSFAAISKALDASKAIVQANERETPKKVLDLKGKKQSEAEVVQNPPQQQPAQEVSWIKLSVSFDRKDEAKSLGAKWNGEQRSWMIQSDHPNLPSLAEKGFLSADKPSEKAVNNEPTPTPSVETTSVSTQAQVEPVSQEKQEKTASVSMAFSAPVLSMEALREVESEPVPEYADEVVSSPVKTLDAQVQEVKETVMAVKQSAQHYVENKQQNSNELYNKVRTEVMNSIKPLFVQEVGNNAQLSASAGPIVKNALATIMNQKSPEAISDQVMNVVKESYARLQSNPNDATARLVNAVFSKIHNQLENVMKQEMSLK